MRKRAGLGHGAGLGKDKSWPVAGVAGSFPDFLLLSIQEAVHVEGFSSVEGGWVLGFNQVDPEAAILGELEVETSRLVPVGLHFPPVDVGYHSHEDLTFVSIARLHLAVGGNEVDQPDFVVSPEVLQRRGSYEGLRIIRIRALFTVELSHEAEAENEGEDHDGGE